VVSFTPWPLYPQGKGTQYPLDRRLGEPQSRSGHGHANRLVFMFVELLVSRDECFDVFPF